MVRNIRRRHYNSYLGEISPAAPNLINRNFHAEKPNEKWLTDITEFRLPAGKVYLSPIIDCFDGMAVTWTIGTSPNARLVNSMLDAAISGLREGERPVLHSDRGGHYRWPGWIQRMRVAGPAALHVGERLFSGQRRLRGILGSAEERDVLWSFLGGRYPCGSLFPSSTVICTGITGSALSSPSAGAAPWTSGAAWG